MEALQIKGLKKSFGKKSVIGGLSFSVKQHSVFGFIGQNGAGKTTTMKMILGLLKPDDGEILVLDERVRYGETKTNRLVGYLPDVPQFYGYMTAREYLKLCGEITGMPGVHVKERSEQLLELVGLSQEKKRIAGFSRGMKQRLGIAQALLNEPALLICDEPTSALDPVGRKEILDILGQVKENTTVIFSTHILSDVERICDRVAILHDGKIALQGELNKIKEKYPAHEIRIEFFTTEDRNRFLSEQQSLSCTALAMENGQGVLVTAADLYASECSIIGILDHLEIAPLKLEVLEPSLERLFMEVVQ